MYNSIEFENYKIFKDRQELQIKPLTILFGRNNVGKSAVLKLPLLIANSFRSKSPEVILPVFNNKDLFTEPHDIVYGRGHRAIRICLNNSSEKKSLKYSFCVDDEREVRSYLEDWSLCIGDKTYDRLCQEGKSDLSGQFHGIIPNDVSADENSALESLQCFIDYIGNVRTSEIGPDLRMGTITECSGWQGEKGYSHLIKDAQTTTRILVNKVSKWYKETFSGWGISIDGSTAPTYRINMTNGLLTTNIVDCGFGIQQSLPIVIRACRPCIQPSLIILEEPEAHLNPAAQGNLGELIAMSAKEDEHKRYLVETHSFNFILRIRALIASEKLQPEDVAVYYVDYDSATQSSKLSKVEIQEDGSVNNWPAGVFEETYHEVVQIRNAQRK